MSTFSRDLWASADRTLWSAFFAELLFGSDEYHIYSVETNIFSDSAPKLKNSVNTVKPLYSGQPL